MSAEADWNHRLDLVLDMVREMSEQTDPQQMVYLYGQRNQQLVQVDGLLGLSRRGLKDGEYKITRSRAWAVPIDPWKESHRLPQYRGGLLADLIYGDQPVVIDDLSFGDDEPAAEHLRGFRSLLAIPNFDGGKSLNMVILLQKAPHAFDREKIPDIVLRSNLFGRATQNLVLAAELRTAYAEVDRELRAVAEIQRALLPQTMPQIPRLELAASYQMCRRAGGDYYDFFPLADGRWGLLIADVSGHGTPAAVVMAVTHSLAHTVPGSAQPPSRLLSYVNEQLCARYSPASGTFVTAFYAVFDPRDLSLTYSSAGHNPPRVKRCSDGTVRSLESPDGLPLGLLERCPYSDTRIELMAGDQLVLYTDGITETMNPEGDLFGKQRLDLILSGCSPAQQLHDAILESLNAFSRGRPADDDRTLVIGRVL
jgi:sigma-B regulation protein RsbU (phosphoserine phosphatase)